MNLNVLFCKVSIRRNLWRKETAMPGASEGKGGSKDPSHVVRLPESEDPFDFAKAAGLRVVWVDFRRGEWELWYKTMGAIVK